MRARSSSSCARSAAARSAAVARRELGERLVEVGAPGLEPQLDALAPGLEVDEELVLEDLELLGDVVVGAGLERVQLFLEGLHARAEGGALALEAFLEAFAPILELAAEGLEVVLDAALGLVHRGAEGLVESADVGARGLEPLEPPLGLGGVLGQAPAEFLEDLGLEGGAFGGEPRLDDVAVVLDLGDDGSRSACLGFDRVASAWSWRLWP